MAAGERVAPWQRFRPGYECPVCGGDCEQPSGSGRHCWGIVGREGDVAFCTHEEQDGPLKETREWFGTMHVLGEKCPCGWDHGTVDLAAFQNGHAQNSTYRRTPSLGHERPQHQYERVRDWHEAKLYRIERADGTLAGIHVRWEGTQERDGALVKRYTWRHHNTLPSGEMPLYAVRALLEMPKGGRVFVTEGEKACDALRERGLVAVGTVTRASATPCDATLRALLGYDVVLWPDADTSGADHMERIAARLSALGGGTARRLLWPAAPAKGDAADYFAGGGTVAGLEALIETRPNTTPKITMTVIRASAVVEKPLRWLWPRYIPLGKSTLVEGEPDKGKSQVILDVIARLTTGREMPDGSVSQVGGAVDVILMSCEDDEEDTIVPRLRLAGADLDRVHLILQVEMPDGTRELPTLPRDIPLLHAVITRTGSRAVFVDPLVGYLDPKIDSHKDANVRRALNALHAEAKATDTAVAGIRHFTKDSKETNPLHRGGGSIGLIGFARAAVAIVPDTDPRHPERRYFGVTKHNLGPIGTPTLSYEITPKQTTIQGEVVELSVVKWTGTDRRTIRDLLVEGARGDEGGERKGAMARCYARMEELLADGKEHRATEIEEALGEADIGANTIAACRKGWAEKGRLILRKRGGTGKGEEREPFYWTWRMAAPMELADE